jgi:hypothetical protein
MGIAVRPHKGECSKTDSFPLCKSPCYFIATHYLDELLACAAIEVETGCTLGHDLCLAGDALLFFDMDIAGSKGDRKALHASCPTLKVH